MEKIKLGISGITGKMGLNVLAIASQMPEHFDITSGLHKSQNSPQGIQCFSSVNDFLSSIDLCIDFSSRDNLMNMVKANIPNPPTIVSGTTGLSDADIKELKNYSLKSKIFFASNFSIGVNILHKLIKTILPLIENQDFDMELLERHHKLKKDAPSGTTLSLLQEIADLSQKTIPDIAQFRTPDTPMRDSKKIGVSFQRAGGIIGEHEISFTNEYEEIILKHTAFNRQVFAKGAIDAALWILKQKNGFYTMKNIIN